MQRSELVATRTEVVSELGVCAGGHVLEAEAGARILAEGGNAVDALVAAAFTGFVVEPASCGLGGYGHLAVWIGPERRFLTVDHNVRVPRGARADMFEVDESVPWTYYGWPRTKGRKNEWGYLAAAVPGAVAGLCEAHERLGRLPLAQVLEPAIEQAELGILVDWLIITQINERLEAIDSLPHTAAVLLRNGRPPTLGEGPARLEVPGLAATLREIAVRGAAGFYTGWVAEAIAREFAEHGGILDAADLAAYRTKVLVERPSSYRGHDYVTANDQVGIEALNILEHFDLAGPGPDSWEYRHLVAEAMGHAFVDSMLHYGDPEFTESPVNGLASRGFAEERAALVSLERAVGRPIAAGDPWPYEDVAQAPERLPERASVSGFAGTSQMAAADREGTVASLCTTLTSGFGSVVLVPEAGVFLNNSMQNYDPRPEQQNRIEPGKMPIFGVPTMAVSRDGEGVLAAAGSGGYRITSGVLHTVLNRLDHGLALQAAVDHPRVHCQGQETFVDSRIPADVRARLADLGHEVVVQEEKPTPTRFARVCAVARDPATGLLHAASGPAWTTAAAGV